MKLAMQHVVLLQRSQVHELTRDARVVAIRWDLLDWGVVLDLDAPVSEANDADMRRAWLAFSVVDEITVAIKEARVPTGIWLTSSLEQTSDEKGYSVFSCHALLPVLDGDSPSSTLSIRAQGIFGLVSRGSCRPGEYGLSFEARQSLCSDAELLSALLRGLREGV